MNLVTLDVGVFLSIIIAAMMAALDLSSGKVFLRQWTLSGQAMLYFLVLCSIATGLYFDYHHGTLDTLLGFLLGYSFCAIFRPGKYVVQKHYYHTQKDRLRDLSKRL